MYSFHCILFSKLASSDGNRLSVFIGKTWMAVGYGISPDAAFYMIVPHQCIDHIFQCTVVRIAEFDLNDLSQLILESFLAPCFHLPFGKGFLIAAFLRILIVIILPNRMHKPSLHTLRSEELAHFPQISFVPSECSACFKITVADQEMNMLVRRICMYREQHLIALKESFCKRLCDSECLLVSQLVIVLR